MNVRTTVKSIQDIMRQEVGVDGDAQRISQLTWLFFLKIIDDQDQELEITRDDYHSPIPERFQWRTWAADPEGITGQALLDFVNDDLFPALKGLQITGKPGDRRRVVRDVFEDAYNYMKSGQLLRQVVNKIAQIDFNNLSERQHFGEIYEQILNDLQSAGNAGEYYTPRAVTSFMVQMIDPHPGETLFDPACGTGGLLDCPWVNSFVDIRLVHGWPFLISQWRNGTLSDLIANPLAWTDVDRLASLLQIVRVLRMAAERGIGAHQDLKPDNVLFVDLHRKFRGTADAPGLRFQILVADFGNADAFREFGRNTGSRPYMAPEQYLKDPLEATAGAAIDIFAVGVIAHKCFCDGRHPIGKITSDVWPRRSGVSRKWGEAGPWRKWAELEDKDLSLLKERCPSALFPLLSRALAPDPERRPDAERLETGLWEALEAVASDAHANVRFQVEQLEAMYAGNEWPSFEERLASLREFYAQRR